MTIATRLEKLEKKRPPQDDIWMVVLRGDDPTPTERYSVPKLIPGWEGKTEPVKHEFWNRVTKAWRPDLEET